MNILDLPPFMRQLPVGDAEDDQFSRAAARVRRQYRGGDRPIPPVLEAIPSAASALATGMIGYPIDLARRIMTQSENLRLNQEYDPGPVMEAAMAGYGAGAGPAMARSMSQPMVAAMRAAPKTSAASGATLGTMATTSEAGDVTPSRDPLSAVQLPPEPQRPSPYQIPQMPPEIQAAGPRRRQAWLAEQSAVKRDTDAQNAASYADAVTRWKADVEDIKTKTMARVAQEEERRANLPMRQQFPLAFNLLNYGPAVIGGIRANTVAGALRRRVDDQWSRYRAVQDAVATRAATGKKPLKSQESFLASPPPETAHMPWRTIGEGAAGSAAAPLLPFMFDYQRLQEGTRGRQEAEKALTTELPVRLAAGAAEGLVAGATGAKLPALNWPFYRFRR